MLSKPRYTLTEGDFHHLKNARLTHLHIQPPALNIVTIHECESVENSITVTTHPAAKSALSIFQVVAFGRLLLLTCHRPQPGCPRSCINHAVGPENTPPQILDNELSNAERKSGRLSPAHSSKACALISHFAEAVQSFSADA